MISVYYCCEPTFFFMTSQILVKLDQSTMKPVYQYPCYKVHAHLCSLCFSVPTFMPPSIGGKLGPVFQFTTGGTCELRLMTNPSPLIAPVSWWCVCIDISLINHLSICYRLNLRAQMTTTPPCYSTPALKQTCSSAMVFSTCSFTLFSMIFSMTLLKWLMRLIVR